MQRPSLLCVVSVLLLAAFFRFHLLGADVRFHPDEAYFAAFARNAAVRGAWMLPGELDKPPLTLYAQAGAMAALATRWDGRIWQMGSRQGEFAARTISLFVSLLLVAVTARLGAALSGQKGPGNTAALLVALSPYGVAFGPTAFTDMPMVLGVMLALWLAWHGRGGWAGFWLILAYASKQQAALFAPLVILALLRLPRRWRKLAAFGMAAGVGFALLALWDAARPFPSVFVLAAEHNAPERWLAPPAAWGPRLLLGLFYGRYLFGGPWQTLLLLGLALTVAWRGDRWQKALLAYLVGYTLLHWLVPFNIYDRYLLPVLPLWAVLAANGINSIPRWRWPLTTLIALAMLPGAWQAATIHPVVGGDKGQHEGIIELAAYLNERAFGSIVYDRWLGWELSYYLGGWTDKRRAYYPTPQQMLDDPTLYTVDIEPRYFPIPANANFGPWQQSLHAAGFDLCISYQSQHFTVYALAPAEVSATLASECLPTSAP